MLCSMSCEEHRGFTNNDPNRVRTMVMDENSWALNENVIDLKQISTKTTFDYLSGNIHIIIVKRLLDPHYSCTCSIWFACKCHFWLAPQYHPVHQHFIQICLINFALHLNKSSFKILMQIIIINAVSFIRNVNSCCKYTMKIVATNG